MISIELWRGDRKLPLEIRLVKCMRQSYTRDDIPERNIVSLDALIDSDRFVTGRESAYTASLLDDTDEEGTAGTDYRAKLAQCWPMLRPEDREVLEMTLSGKRQVDIAAFFGVNQSAISYRLRAAQARLRDIAGMPRPLSPRRRLTRILGQQRGLCVELLRLVSSQSRATYLLRTRRHRRRKGYNQIKLRYNVLRSIKLLEEGGHTDLAEYVGWLLSHPYLRQFVRAGKCFGGNGRRAHGVKSKSQVARVG